MTIFSVCIGHHFEVVNFLERRNSEWVHFSKIKVRSHKSNVTSNDFWLMLTQLAITCSKLTIETLEQGVKYDQSYQ